MSSPLCTVGRVCVALLVSIALLPMVDARAAELPVQTNDTFRDGQWYLDAIHAREGWNASTGSRDVIVAVIDGGMDIDHPDLRENIWINTQEIAGNGKDDDGNGYVDDVHGWNFVTRSPDVRPSRDADVSETAWIHGTAVASLLAASGNDDIGIAGVAWRAQIMPVVVLGGNGFGRDATVSRAIAYAVMQGADIINLSLVGYEFDEGLRRAINDATAKGVLVVSAAGNSESNVHGEDTDTTPAYPACEKGALGRGAISVTALTRENTKAPRANYGRCVDVSAPGAGLFAARPTTESKDPTKQAPGYTGRLDGTSVAAPLVSGLAVLLKTMHPMWSGAEIAQRILSTADSVDALNPFFQGKMGKGRINVARALAQDTPASYATFVLETARVGHEPEVRIKDASGKDLARFLIAERGDRRGFEAALVDWQGQDLPAVVISMLNDPTQAWRVYRFDGVLLAAGEGEEWRTASAR